MYWLTYRTLVKSGTIAAVVSAIVGVGLCVGSEPIMIQPASGPIVPLIPPPVPPSSHHIRFQDLVPGYGKGGEPGGQGKVETEESGPELTLGECIAIALERQPSLKAARASMETTEKGYRALTNFGTVGTWLSPDLEVRKKQAQRGLAASSGMYQQAHNEVIQDVTRLYFTAVYARQQAELGKRTVDTLAELEKIIKDLVEGKTSPEMLGGLNTGKLRVVQMGVNTAKQLQLKATIGRKQAMAALRQVMAVDESSFSFRVKDAELPLMAQRIPISKQVVVDQALCRRPELALAAAGVDVFRLEVYAQGKIPFRRVVPTFASGADIHSKEIPQAIRGKDYRPGAIPPEMPPQLVGSKYDRVERAMSFSQKAEAVYESARSLVVLEAENAFYEFELANERLILAKQNYDLALDLDNLTRRRADSIKEKDLLVQAYVTVAKGQSDYIEAVYEYLLSLAALERITAGGISPAFPGR